MNEKRRITLGVFFALVLGAVSKSKFPIGGNGGKRWNLEENEFPNPNEGMDDE